LTVSAVIQNDDKSAVLAVWNGFTNKESLGWDTTQDLCTQGGVTCDSSSPQRVTGITFFGNGLTGTLSTQIGHLPYLQVLNLAMNSLTGTIPTHIGNLRKLDQLLLSSNQFSGSIPTHIGLLTNLNQLEIFGNSLVGAIPTQFGNLVGLSTINLSWNKLTGTIPTHFGKLSGLYALWIKGNTLTGTLPNEILQLPALRQLILAANHLDCNVADYSKYIGDDSSVYQSACSQYCPPNQCSTGNVCYLSGYSSDYSTFTESKCRPKV